MIEKINETGYILLRNGTIFQSFKESLEGTFMGLWVWVLLLLVIDAVILLKTRNAFLTATLNMMLLITLNGFFPATIYMYLLIPSIMAVAGAIYFVWK
jgi:hypothetical protein